MTVFAGTHADAADDIDYDSATATEIDAHLDELEAERDDAAADLEELQTQLADAQAVIEAATADYGTSGAQLTVVTAAVRSADDELGAKVSTLVDYAQQQSEKYEEAQEATEASERLEAQIETTEKRVEDLDAKIDEAEEAFDEAAAAEAAEAAAAEAAEAETESATTSDSGSDSSGESSSSSDSSSSSTAAYSSDAATAAVQFAKNQLGEPYVFGAAGPDSWDCSGLVVGAYNVSGVSLTHSTWAIWDQTSSIGRGDLKPGDLVFYNGQNHVGIYIGGGEVVHAPKPGDVVKISPLDMGMSIDGYRRI
ncbi:C40 family peptidase [Glycomyces sp. NRRL B-16210]|uniref:C40 family peptidase n=1 Tax=Glycomyces sp. NRRL B-16210 TaxID=1463821 RepID=UPI00068C23D8|nr:C40 family peptidase [Glycomyces sp. NRRL B-16210]